MNLVLGDEVLIEVWVPCQDRMSVDDRLDIVHGDLNALLRNTGQLPCLISLHILVPVSEKDLSRDFDLLVQRVMDEMTSVPSGTALRAVVHATRDCLVVFGFLKLGMGGYRNAEEWVRRCYFLLLRHTGWSLHHLKACGH